MASASFAYPCFKIIVEQRPPFGYTEVQSLGLLAAGGDAILQIMAVGRRSLVSLNKPWLSFDPHDWRGIAAAVGVYELGDEDGQVIYIGFAGGASPFGLRGEIARRFSPEEANPVIRQRARLYRYEVTTMYLSRWRELLILHREEHGGLPPANEASEEHLPSLGRFHWRPSTGQWQP